MQYSQTKGINVHSKIKLSGKIRYPQNLPILQKKDAIIQSIRQNQVVIISGETGSGKSTQIPKFCLEANLSLKGIIGCTQPRRIAASSLARRVAFELKNIGNRLVGYKIRFKDTTHPSTLIKFMTDGILLAETQTDKMLKAYEILLIDEAHERSLNIDFLLGILKNLLLRRRNLKLIITSATIDTEKFSKFFGNAPIIEVSGKVYPIEERYKPLDSRLEEAGDLTYIDQAVEAVKEIKQESCDGDILIFMPCERDIWEMLQRLRNGDFSSTLILPLFGRLSSVDQNRVFKSTEEQKIIISTNIAETSITLPGIRYVIDTGLARIAQYNPRLRIQTLPIQNISRSSADQRKGRCGRVKSGICFRLYSQDEYESWPLFTPPEIIRSNLAEVILRMLFLKLDTISRFPFIDSPSQGAIKDGFSVLRELRAIDSDGHLTNTGILMARLPLDPRISRMIIEARKEDVVSEIIIIASALSIQDPRERPAEKQGLADEMHSRFMVPESDFLSLLKIWDAYHDTLERLKTQNQMRKFCNSHFLSYRRMREWRDIHEQISIILKEEGGYPMHKIHANYDRIHRAILSGLLSNIAQRDVKKPKEKNVYSATKGKEVMIFPGSGQFGRAGEWIVSAHMVQTSRLFARMVATINPEWIEVLAGDLCKITYHDPHWEKDRGEVIAYQQKSLYGLIIVSKRRVSYGSINPEESRKIFIRAALVEQRVKGKFAFLEHNHALITSIKQLEDKIRRRDLLVDEETIFNLYADRIEKICSIVGLKKLLRERGDSFLKMQMSDLLCMMPDKEKLAQFPDTLNIKDVNLSLSYRFSPGDPDDGVTVTIPIYSMNQIEPEIFEYLVPGLLYEKIAFLLKGLPKLYRKRLIPINESAEIIFNSLSRKQNYRSLYRELGAIIYDTYRVNVPYDVWPRNNLLPYHSMGYRVVDQDGKVLGKGKNFYALSKIKIKDDEQWIEACKRWQRTGIETWDFEGVPDKILISNNKKQIPFFAYPGIYACKEDMGKKAAVELRLYRSSREAARATRGGLKQLYMIQFKIQLKQFKKQWALPDSWSNYCKSFGGTEGFNEMLFDFILNEIFKIDMPTIPTKEEFTTTIETMRTSLIPKGREIVLLMQDLLKQSRSTHETVKRFMHMAGGNQVLDHIFQNLLHDIRQLLPANFLRIYDFDRVREIPRYLKAVEVRAQRAYVSPQKDSKKADQLLIHQKNLAAAIDEWEKTDATSPERIKLINEYRWMIQEYSVSLFAPELKTPFSVSHKRLMQKWQQIQNHYPN
ncbi:MAG: ATP-dependent RNA helicase HrpA [bacterium]